MAKKVYKPNPLLDILLPILFTSLAAFVIRNLYIEGRYFWTLVVMTIVVTILVLGVEYCLRIFGRWLSRTWLSDSHHEDPLSHNLALKKFVDQGWQLVYHSLFAFWEYLLLRKFNWFEGERLFFSVSEEEIAPDSIKFLFISQIALWLFQAYRHVFVNQRKKDYYELFIHHIATLSLCYVAYDRYYHLGLLILFLHDFSDILIDTLKLLNLCKISGSEDYFLLETEYVLTCAVWSYERLYLLPYLFLQKGLAVCWKLYSDVPRIEMLKAEWIFLLQIACLVVLYILHWYWFILLLRIGLRAFVTERENIRQVTKEGYEGASDTESEDEDEDEKGNHAKKHKKSE